MENEREHPDIAATKARNRKLQELYALIKQQRLQIDQMQSKEEQDRLYRESRPALQDAWEKYQTILRLSREENV